MQVIRVHPTAFARLGFLVLLALAIWPSAGGPTNAASMRAPVATCNLITRSADVAPVRTPSLITVQEGFNCLLAHYVTGSKLDDRVLLHGAYSQMTATLQGNGLALPATISEPAFTGKAATDWQLFAAVYQRIAALLPAHQFIPGVLPELALYGMTGSLNDRHTSYYPGDQLHPYLAQLFDSGPVPTVGVVISPIDPSQPLYVTDVLTGTAAARAGMRPGDVITLVNGHDPYADVQGLLGLAPLVIPQVGVPLTLVVTRPATQATLTFHLAPQSLKAPDTIARIVAGDVYYVKLFGFTADAANEVFADIKALHGPAGMEGVVLDLRGNGGGLVDGAVRLLSAFVHNKTLFISVDGNGKRDPQKTDNSVPLLHQHLVVLTDSGSASSSEIIASAVRDYHLGTIVGTRTAGALAGAEFYGLSDGSGLEITEAHVLGAKGEVVDGVGVTPDNLITTTARDLSTGHDYTIDQAVRNLRKLSRAA